MISRLPCDYKADSFVKYSAVFCLSSQSRLLPYRRSLYFQSVRCSRSNRPAYRCRGVLVQCTAHASSGQSREEPKTSWRQRLLKAARVFFGLIAVFVACDVLHFLGGSRPPTDGQAWHNLAANEEDGSSGGPRAKREPIIIYDKHNRVIAQFASSTVIPLNEIPDHVWQSVVSSEDRTFFQHPGLDVRGLARAVLFAGTRGGGSTITQQLVKNSFLSDSRTISRKVFEMVIAMVLEVHSSKTRILETYLQTAYFGHGAFGISHAANTYFRKRAQDLTLNEAALLAATLPSPETLSPVRDPDGSVKRLATVLKSMHLMGYLSDSQLQSALSEGLPASLSSSAQRSKGNSLPKFLAEAPSRAPYFVEKVMKKLQEITDGRSMQGGLHVYTTADLRLQEHAERVLRSDGLMQPPGPLVGEAALVAVEPGSGAVRVLVGGRDYSMSQYNRAVHACRPCASVFKPAVYLTALEHRLITPSSLLPDQPLKYARRVPKTTNRAPLSFLFPHSNHSASSAAQPPSAPTTSPQHASAQAHGHPRGAPTAMNRPSADRPTPHPFDQPAAPHMQRGALRGRAQPVQTGAPVMAVSLAQPESGGEWVCTSTACPLSEVSPPLRSPRRQQPGLNSEARDFFKEPQGGDYEVMRLSAKYRRQLRQPTNSNRFHASPFRSIASITHMVSKLFEKLDGTKNYEKIETRLLAAQQKAVQKRIKAAGSPAFVNPHVEYRRLHVRHRGGGPLRSYYSLEEPGLVHSDVVPEHRVAEQLQLDANSVNAQNSVQASGGVGMSQRAGADSTPLLPSHHSLSRPGTAHLQHPMHTPPSRTVDEEMWETVQRSSASRAVQAHRAATTTAHRKHSALVPRPPVRQASELTPALLHPPSTPLPNRQSRTQTIDLGNAELVHTGQEAGRRLPHRSPATPLEGTDGQGPGEASAGAGAGGSQKSRSPPASHGSNGVDKAQQSVVAKAMDSVLRASGTPAATGSAAEMVVLHSRSITAPRTAPLPSRGNSNPDNRQQETQVSQNAAKNAHKHPSGASSRWSDGGPQVRHALRSHQIPLHAVVQDSSSEGSAAQTHAEQHQEQEWDRQASASPSVRGPRHAAPRTNSSWRLWWRRKRMHEQSEPAPQRTVDPPAQHARHTSTDEHGGTDSQSTAWHGHVADALPAAAPTLLRSSLTVLPQQSKAAASSNTHRSAKDKEAVEYQVVEEYLPTNVTSKFAGVVTARTALVHSLNAPAVALAYEVGLDNVRGCAEALGMPMPDTPTLSLALGTNCATPLQVAASYAALAARGNACEPYLVRLVKDSRGSTIFRHRKKTRRVARRASCDQLTSMLKDAYRSGTAASARRWCPKVVAAAKTGTSDDCRDAWLAGYTGSLATVVWVGRDDNGPLAGTASRVAAPIWGRFMAAK